MELRTYWKIIRKRWWLVLLLGAIMAASAVYTESRRVPLYSSTTTMFLNPAAANPLLPYQATKTVQSTANTYMEFIRTRSFAGLVAQQSGLAISPEQVIAALSSQYVPDTQFFRITATFTDPATAQRLADTAANTLIAENSARQQAEQAQLQSQRDQDPERQQLTQLRDTLREELALYTQRITSTQEQIGNLEARLPSERNDERLNELRDELVSLQQARGQALNSVAQIQSALVESNPVGAASSDTAVIVDRAPLPAGPLPMPFLRTVLLWLIAGLALGVGLSVGLEYLDYTVRSPEALEQVYGMASQGVIGTVGGRKRKSNQPEPSYQLTVSEPRSPDAESIRSLRTSVQIAGLNRPLRSLLVTSAGPGEGKSFTAANLAVSVAQYGLSVLLVDLDLRKPSVHGVFGIPREPGFTNLVLSREAELPAAVMPQLRTLSSKLYAGQGNVVTLDNQGPIGFGTAQRMLREAEQAGPELAALAAEVRQQLDQAEDLHQYVRPSGITNLALLTAGTIPPHPSELLGSPRAAQLMNRLHEQFDLVVYDSPPAGIVTDAVIVASRVDGILHVVRAGKTRIDLIRRCKAMLEQAGGKIIGPVLNQVRISEMGSYSYYYYYGYGEKQKNGKADA